ncbi:MAG: hypothetical protein ACIAXF_03685 [Phycisphaerales bacterium JB063]
MNELRFAGAWPLWAVVALALVGGLLAWLLYRRELKRGWMGWLLPTLRALAVMLVLLMLAGPELVHTTGEDHRGQVLVLVDASRSMGVTDEQMPLGEKLLAARRLGLTQLDGFDTGLVEAGQQMDAAAALAGDPATVERDPAAAAQRVADLAQGAYESLRSSDPDLAEQMQQDVVDRARRLGQDADTQDESQTAADLAQSADALASWGSRLSQRFDQQANALRQTDGGAIDDAVAQFDALSRWERAQRLLLDIDAGVLSDLSQAHHVELVLLDGVEASSAWSSADASAAPLAFESTPTAGATDLSTAMSRMLDRAAPDDRLAVVMVTDGRQNQGTPLPESAGQARSRGAAVHSLALGSTRSPHDLSVVDVIHPPSLFPDDRVTGSVTLVDAMPAGDPFSVQIVAGEQVLWETQQVTIGGGQVRQVDFDFPIRDAVDQAVADAAQGVTINQLGVPMEVRIVGLEGDRESANDRMDFQVRAVLGKRKMLILAGRPRWEMKFVETMFARDPRWDVTTLIAMGAGEPIPRSDTHTPGEPAFPASKAQLFTYDIVVLGEVPPGVLNDRELGWLYEFVANRAGGMVVIDGRRGHLGRYQGTAIGPLLPVRRDERGLRPHALELTPEGRRTQALRLEPDAAVNVSTWGQLLAPSYLAPIEVVPGADTVLLRAAVGRDGEEHWPVVMTRRVGAGWVWYSAMDETWRWRREFESLYQERYWHQVTHRVVEPLYAAEDQYVSLGVDQVVVEAGQDIPVRVRIRDEAGQPRVSAESVAYLTNMIGERVAQITLKADAAEGGRFTGEINAGLAPGVYEVGVSVEGVSETHMLAKTLITVRAGDSVTGELADLTLNLDMLEQVAATTGGRVLREHQADQLTELLDGLSYSTKEQTVRKLWQDWPWFGSVVLLLGVELLLRRRLGMI